MNYFAIKLAALGVGYIFVTAISMGITGRSDFLEGLNQGRWLSLKVIGIFFVSMCFALSARVIYVLINKELFNNAEYKSNAASISAAITALSYLGILFFNMMYLGEPWSYKIGLGLFLITIGCFICMY